jgi:outer membrane biosynthesis protein TonB
MSRDEKDKKNKQAGMIISAGVHIALILLFIFLVAWRAPNPPLPEFGIELNFGTSDQGTGDIQPQTAPAESEAEEDALPDTPEEVIEETTEETIPEETEVTETTTDPVEAVTTDVQEEIIPVTDQETEAPVKEPEAKPEEVKPKVEEKKKDEPKPVPPKVLYPGKKDGAAGTIGETTDPAAANQGDKTNTLGDQGDKEGNVDARALYGKPGGGGGSSLEMTGWMWDTTPDPKENTSESGKIVFEVIIDDRGEITSAKPISYTVSASLVRIYQAEVERLTFSKTSTGPAPPSSKGKITFIIKAK